MSGLITMAMPWRQTGDIHQLGGKKIKKSTWDPHSLFTYIILKKSPVLLNGNTVQMFWKIYLSILNILLVLASPDSPFLLFGMPQAGLSVFSWNFGASTREMYPFFILYCKEFMNKPVWWVTLNLLFCSMSTTLNVVPRKKPWRIWPFLKISRNNLGYKGQVNSAAISLCEHNGSICCCLFPLPLCTCSYTWFDSLFNLLWE